MNIQEAAKRLSILPRTLQRWKRKYGVELPEGQLNSEGELEYSEDDIKSLLAKSKPMEIDHKRSRAISDEIRKSYSDRQAGNRGRPCEDQQQELVPVASVASVESDHGIYMEDCPSLAQVFPTWIRPEDRLRYNKLIDDGWVRRKMVGPYLGQKYLPRASVLRSVRQTRFAGKERCPDHVLYDRKGLKAVKKLLLRPVGLLSAREAAKKWGVSPTTIREGVRRGLLKVKRTMKLSKLDLFTESSVLAYLKKNPRIASRIASLVRSVPPVGASPLSPTVLLPSPRVPLSVPKRVRPCDPVLPLLAATPLKKAGNSGWTCSKCGRSYSPVVTECVRCNSEVR